MVKKGVMETTVIPRAIINSVAVWCAHDKVVDVDSLIPNPRNPNIHPDNQIDALAKIIKYQGWRCPITVSNRSGFIVRGHGRLMAAKKIGLHQVPVDCQDYENEAAEWADLLADNKIPELSSTDDALMLELLSDIKDADFDMELTGFDVSEIEDILGDDDKGDNGVDTDDTPEVKQEARSKIGDLYILGKHRVLCGDSTSKDDVARLMDGGKAEILFTSPPYFDQRIYEGNKNLSIEHIIQFIPCFKPFTIYQVINLGIVIRESEVVEYWQNYIKIAKESGYKLLSWNVWDKLQAGSVGQQNRMFAIEHEWIFIFGKQEKKINRTVEKKESSFECIKNYKKDEYDRLVKRMRNKDGSIKNSTIGEIYDKKNMGTVLRQYPELSREFTDKHPAIMRVDVPIAYIEAMTNENQIIIDPFIGSGSTMIACEKTGRICYGIEIELLYIDVIVSRYVKFTGNNKIIKNGEQIEWVIGDK